MPDLMSHLLIGLILAELFRIRKKSLVVLGAIAPDLLGKVHLIYFYLKLPPVISFVSFHTPVIVFLISILIAPLFIHNKFKTVLFFNIGAMSHFLSDLTMKHFTIRGSRLFFPFSSDNYSLGLVWPEDSIFILIGCLLIYLIIKIFKKDINIKSIKNIIK